MYNFCCAFSVLSLVILFTFLLPNPKQCPARVAFVTVYFAPKELKKFRTKKRASQTLKMHYNGTRSGKIAVFPGARVSFPPLMCTRSSPSPSFIHAIHHSSHHSFASSFTPHEPFVHLRIHLHMYTLICRHFTEGRKNGPKMRKIDKERHL